MNHKTQNTAHEQGKSLRNILYVWDGIHRNQKMGAAKLGEAPPVESKKGLTPIKGKGPPGRPRSPGHYPEHPPDEATTPVRFPKPDRCKFPGEPTLKTRLLTGNTTKTEYQIINNNQKQILLTIKFLLS